MLRHSSLVKNLTNSFCFTLQNDFVAYTICYLLKLLLTSYLDRLFKLTLFTIIVVVGLSDPDLSTYIKYDW